MTKKHTHTHTYIYIYMHIYIYIYIYIYICFLDLFALRFILFLLLISGFLSNPEEQMFSWKKRFLGNKEETQVVLLKYKGNEGLRGHSSFVIKIHWQHDRVTGLKRIRMYS